MDYHDFDVFLREGPSGDWLGDLRTPDGAERTVPIHFPYDPPTLRDRLTHFEVEVLDSRGVQSAEAVEVPPRGKPDAKRFGADLFRAIFGADADDLLRVSLANVRKNGAGLRIRITNEIPALAAVPWEFMYDPQAERFLAVSEETPLVRHLRVSRPREGITVNPPLRILCVIANPSGLEALNVDAEVARMERATRGVRDGGLVELERVETATWRELQAALRRGPWHVFHYIGHGDYDESSEEGYLAFEDESGQSHPLYASELSDLLGDHDPLQLCVLNSCSGARGDAEDRFSSTAAALIRRGVPAVVAMQYEIGDAAAVEFSQTLYEALTEGTPVDRAVAGARKAMRIGARGSLEWGTPVLHMRSTDGVLFRVDVDEEAAAENEPVPPATRSDTELSVPVDPPEEVKGWQGWSASLPVVLSRVGLIAVFVALGLTLWWTSSATYEMEDSLYVLFGFTGLVVATVIESLIARFRR